MHPTIIVIGLLFLLANLAILALNLKLYTEILKDQSQNRRVKAQKEKQNEEDGPYCTYCHNRGCVQCNGR